jgi:hypothetical protein
LNINFNYILKERLKIQEEWLKEFLIAKKHDYHSHGMCKKCIESMLLEQNKDLKWLN